MEQTKSKDDGMNINEIKRIEANYDVRKVAWKAMELFRKMASPSINMTHIEAMSESEKMADDLSRALSNDIFYNDRESYK